MIENIFTVKEIEAILKKSQKDVSYLLRSKRLQYFRDNGKIRVKEKALNDFFFLVGKESLKKQMAAKNAV